MLCQPPEHAATRLEDGYEPSPFDVICGRESELHIGNHRFRVLVNVYVGLYSAAQTRRDKTAVIKEIMERVRSSGGRFIRQEDPVHHGIFSTQKSQRTPVYIDVGSPKAADKVRHALRRAAKARMPNHRRQSWPAGTANVNKNDAWTKEDARMSYAPLCRSAFSESITNNETGNKGLNLNANVHARQPLANEYAGGFNVYNIGKANLGKWIGKSPTTTWTSQSSSWHAGFMRSEDDNDLRNGHLLLSNSDISLASNEWDLKNLQDDDINVGSEAAFSFGDSIISSPKVLSMDGQHHQQIGALIVCEQQRSNDGLHRKGQVTTADEDDDISWDDSLF